MIMVTDLVHQLKDALVLPNQENGGHSKVEVIESDKKRQRMIQRAEVCSLVS